MYDDWMQYIPIIENIDEEKIKNRYKTKEEKNKNVYL